ncbi:MAG: class I SAM-dependent methyltransferase [Anaerolineae bacterium]
MPGTFWWILVCCLFGGAVCYWLIVLTEGTFLGPRVVAWLYDLSAHQYNAIKKNQFVYEARHIGIPLVQALGERDAWRLLDVASGTGRVPLAILAAGSDRSMIWGIDGSARMLALAQQATSEYDSRVAVSQQEAAQLAFADTVFEGVVCLEALEFMAHPRQVLIEMRRVLKPGGIMLLSNRVGRDAWFFPSRMCGRGRLENELFRLGFKNIRMERWQEHYDLIWATKPASWLERQIR